LRKKEGVGDDPDTPETRQRKILDSLIKVIKAAVI